MPPGASRSPCQSPVEVQVTVVTATWNSAATIAACLESVSAQTCADSEHLIIDGASTDGTQDLVRAADGARLVSEPDQGIYDAFNKGLRHARGELIAFLGSDDVYAGPEVLARVVEAANRYPDVDVFHGDLTLVDGAGRVVGEPRFYPKHPIDSARNRANYAGTWLRQVFHPATFVRRRVFERVGGFDTSYRIAGDTEHLLRAYEAGATFRYLPGVFVRMRNDGISSRRRWEAELETLRAFRAHADSPLRPWVQFARAQLVGVFERRAPRALRVVRWLKGSPRLTGYGERLRSETDPDRPGSAPR